MHDNLAGTTTGTSLPVRPGSAPSARAELWAGARAIAPMMAAYIPFGLLVGAAVSSSANPPAAWLATWTIYGGAAHLAVLDVLHHGSGWVAAAAVGLLVNARLTAYATAMTPQWRGTRLRLRILAGLLLTDAPWALTRARDGSRYFYLGAAGALWFGWPTLVTVGAVSGGLVDQVPVADLMSAMTLGAVVVTQLRERPVAVAVLTATVSAVLTRDLAPGPALAVSAVAGATAGYVAAPLRQRAA